MPSGATEFLAAVGCWRDRRLRAKRRRHGVVRRSESRQTTSPSANARAPWGRATTSDSRPAFPDDPPLWPAKSVRLAKRGFLPWPVERRTGPPAKTRLRGGETSTRDCHSGEAVSPTCATKPFARPANGPPATTPATTIGALVRERMPGSHRATKVESGLRRMAAVNRSASRPPLKNIGQSHRGRLQRSLGSVSSTFAPPGPRSPGRGWQSNDRVSAPPESYPGMDLLTKKRIVSESGKRRRSRIEHSPDKMVPKFRPMELGGSGASGRLR